MKPVTPLIIKYTVIFIAIRLFLFWLWGFAPFEMPQFVPGTPIKLYGMALMLLFISMLVMLLRKIIRVSPSISIAGLTLKGLLMCFMSEVVLQVIRTFTRDNDRLYTFSFGVISMTLFNLCLSFLVAYQIKTKNTRRLMIYIAAFILLVNVSMRIFPALIGQ